MEHPELLLVPVMMLADYFMTLLGAVQSRKKHEQHFKTEHYELNPVWQGDVARVKWFNPRHLFLVVVFSSILIFVVESGEMPELLVDALLGAILITIGAVLGRHLANLMIFGHLVWKPDQISGQVTMSHGLVLAISMYQYIVVVIPVVIVAAFMPSPFTVGGLFGIALLLVVHVGWIARHRQAADRAAKPDSGNGG